MTIVTDPSGADRAVIVGIDGSAGSAIALQWAVDHADHLGEIVPVMIKEIDEKHRINLSIKQADHDWAKQKGLNPPTGNFHSRN